MSSVTSQYVTTPTGKSDIASCFSINDTREKFTLFDVSTVGEEYTLSFWIKSTAASSVTINGSTYASSTGWQKYRNTFIATGTDFILTFGAVGTYYIYHMQLETGNMETDWSPAPEDVEDSIANVSTRVTQVAIDLNGFRTTVSETYATKNALETAETSITQNANSISLNATDTKTALDRVAIAEATLQILSDCIKMLVVDEAGGSLMTQSGDRWMFNMGTYEDRLSQVSNNLNTLAEGVGDTNNAVDILNQAVSDLGVMSEYVVITTYNGQPCIELGERDSQFKMRITNTEIQFMDGSSIPAYLSNQKLNIEKAEVKNELQFGDFAWKIRTNGNLGLTWNGGST